MIEKALAGLKITKIEIADSNMLAKYVVYQYNYLYYL